MVFPEDFKQLLTQSVGPEQASVVLDALQEAPSVSIRLNPAKIKECPFPDAQPVEWSPYGYLLKERPIFTLDPLFHAGAYYVQDTSAMYVGHVFREVTAGLQPGATVLDLCAAPGGKTTDLAASLRERFGDSFTLLANEVMRSRYGVLRNNVQTWGDPRVGTVSRDPSAFGSAPIFDAILADVPCSGEGMFRKDAQALAEWSLETVDFCAARSHRILRDIWPTLKPGGILVYSTCTFNHLENDDTAQWVADELGAELLCSKALLPGFVPGEGQFVAALRKKGEPEGIRTADPFKLFKAEVLEPEADFPRWDVNRETALRYLHGDALVLEECAPIGPITICYQGLPLGPAKNLGKRCNNLYPKGKRIRMDIR